MKLSEEKKNELREVKACCKIDVGEFKDRYEKLNKFDKQVIYLAIVDEDFEYEETKENKEKNDRIMEFLLTDIKTAKILYNAVSNDENIIDENGNEYRTYEDLDLN